MKTFDEIIPAISEALAGQENNLEKIGCLVVNRDLNGRIRLVVKDSVKKNATAARALDVIVELLSRELEGRFPNGTNVLYEPDPLNVLKNTAHFSLPGFPGVIIADRLINSSDWLSIEP
ncbi:MAG: hypothetical protein LBQ61_01790, partial [Spirochaetales bacterium]|nr:hypothetical protein [Spirochaetales bacterium]